MSEFERVVPQITASHTGSPTLSVWRNGKLYINKPGVEKWFDGVESVAFFREKGGSRLGISLGDSGDGAVSVSSKDRGGVEMSAARVLREVGIEKDDLNEVVKLGIEEDPDEGLLVVDIEPLHQAVEEGTYMCPDDDCTETFDTERGRDIHHGRIHG